jgi:hypothetical protein
MVVKSSGEGRDNLPLSGQKKVDVYCTVTATSVVCDVVPSVPVTLTL